MRWLLFPLIKGPQCGKRFHVMTSCSSYITDLYGDSVLDAAMIDQLMDGQDDQRRKYLKIIYGGDFVSSFPIIAVGRWPSQQQRNPRVADLPTSLELNWFNDCDPILIAHSTQRWVVSDSYHGTHLSSL